MAYKKIEKWTDPDTGIQMWTNDETGLVYLKRPNVKKPYEFDTKESAIGYYRSLLKAPKKGTAEEQRIERLTTQPEGYPGTVQAQLDSASVYKKAPQFKPEHIKASEKAKQDKADKKTAATSYKKAQTERTDEKLSLYWDRYKNLKKEMNDLVILSKNGDVSKNKEYQLAVRKTVNLFNKIRDVGLQTKFFELLLNMDLPVGFGSEDQGGIFEDPDTGKRYRYVGPDKDDPNSYEEL